MKRKFNPGDRVICKGKSVFGKAVASFHGTVATLNGMNGNLLTDKGEQTLVGVEWDRPLSNGHLLDGNCGCKPYHGWYVYQGDLEFEMSIPEESDLEFGVDELI